MKCKHCKREEADHHRGSLGRWCFSGTTFEPEPEQTPTQQDLETLKARSHWLTHESTALDESTWGAAALYRIVICLAEKAELVRQPYDLMKQLKKRVK